MVYYIQILFFKFSLNYKKKKNQGENRNNVYRGPQVN